MKNAKGNNGYRKNKKNNLRGVGEQKKYGRGNIK